EGAGRPTGPVVGLALQRRDGLADHVLDLGARLGRDSRCLLAGVVDDPLCLGLGGVGDLGSAFSGAPDVRGLPVRHDVTSWGSDGLGGYPSRGSLTRGFGDLAKARAQAGSLGSGRSRSSPVGTAPCAGAAGSRSRMASARRRSSSLASESSSGLRSSVSMPGPAPGRTVETLVARAEGLFGGPRAG